MWMKIYLIINSIDAADNCIENIIIANDGVVSQIHPYFIHILLPFDVHACVRTQAYDLIVIFFHNISNIFFILSLFLFISSFLAHNRIFICERAILSFRPLCGCTCFVYVWFLLHEWSSAFHFFSSLWMFECQRSVLSLPTQSSFEPNQWNEMEYWKQPVNNSIWPILRWRSPSTFTR